MKKLIILFLLCSFINAKEYTIGFSQASLSNSWLKAQLSEMEKSVKNYKNLKLIVKNANGKVANQIKDIEEFTQMGVDFIIAMPLDTKITALALKKALQKGIKVILISRIVDGNDYTAFVGPNNYLIAKDAAKLLAKKISYKGKVLILKGIKSASSTKQRTAGFIEVIKNYPNITVIEKTASYQKSEAMKVMESIYRDKIEFDAIYSQSDSMLIGAREVMKKLEIDVTKIPSVSIDYIAQTQEAILDNEQFAAYVYPTSAKEGIELIVDIINKKNISKVNFIKSRLVIKENASKIEPIF